MRPLSDFSFDLPDDQIARQPLADRAASRLLVVDRAAETFRDGHFRDFPGFLQEGDCLILNNTKVLPARLFGQRPGHTGKIEILLIRNKGARWEALCRPARKLPVGQIVNLSDKLQARITALGENGQRELEFISEVPLEAELQRIGHVPLPPYMSRPDDAADRERYQTIFAKHAGSSAAPTAGLHFTGAILEACKERGAQIAEVTLHVGLGTFQPLTEHHLSSGKLHPERYEVTADAANAINAAHRRLCIGTTSVRTLESGAQKTWPLEPQSGDTQIFIREGFQFRATDALLTNFHLPESSLLMLVAAFAGHDLTLAAYRHAIAEKYRFFSYGDAMLIL